MRVLLDSCVWRGALEALLQAEHDTEWVGNWDHDPGDEAVLRNAFQEGRVVITLDKDFGELAFLRMQPHCGIIRLVGLSAREQGPAAVASLSRYGLELRSGAVVTVSQHRTRIRVGTPKRETEE